MKTPRFLFWSVLITALPALSAAGARPGSVDPDFLPDQRPGTVFATVEQPDGRILIGGYFGVIRLLPNGQTDPSFQAPLAGWPYSGMPPIVSALALQPDGCLLVGGQFEIGGEAPAINLVRLLPDGSRDEALSPGASPNWPVEAIVVREDGRILIGGRFDHYGGTPAPALARLLANGQLDPSFDPGSGPDQFVFGIILQPDGRILIRGNINTYNGIERRGVARLLPDGALDTEFQAEGITGPWVPAMALQGEQILVSVYLQGGSQPGNHLLRLHANGALDTGFDVPLNDGIQAITVQRDARIVVGGFFSEIAGAPRRHVARLTPRGRVDFGFDPRAGAVGQIDGEWSSPGVYSLLLLSDRKVLAGGNFSWFDGRPRSGIVRLQGNFAP
jgi:uncharacterized delta-60 repeat protein